MCVGSSYDTIPDMLEAQVSRDQQVLLPFEYLNDLGVEASMARQQIVVETLTFEPDEVTDQVASIYQAASTSAKRICYLDEYARLTSAGVFNKLNSLVPWLRSSIEVSIKEKDALFTEFRDRLNVDLRFSHPPTLLQEWLPVLGRGHLKAGVVDNKVFYFGGVNLDRETAHAAEMMVKFTGNRARKLSQYYEAIHAGEIEGDAEIMLDETTSLLYDTGIPGQSIILDKAIQLIEGAKASIKNTSFLIPDGKVAKALNQAYQKGIAVEVLTASPPPDGFLPISFATIKWLTDRLSLLQRHFRRMEFPIVYNPFRLVHSKLLIIDNERVLFGSHNLSDKGVKAGTKEWSILTRDPQLVKDLTRFYYDVRLEMNPNLQEVL